MSKLYSPPSRNYPQELPDYWKFEDGTVRTDLQELSDAELEVLGWHGPITMPEDIEGTSPYTHDYTWNPNTLSFDVQEITYDEKRRRVDYRKFWSLITRDLQIEEIDSSLDLYEIIRSSSFNSLHVNSVVTEFSILMFEAMRGNDNVPSIQRLLLEILSLVDFTSDQLQELNKILIVSGMSAIYSLQ